MEPATKHVLVVSDNKRPINSASFSPDGKLILISSDSYTVKLWSSLTRKEVKKISFDSFVGFSSFSNNGLFVVSAGNDYVFEGDLFEGKPSLRGILRIWIVSDGRVLRRIIVNDLIFSAFFSPDDQKIVAGSSDGHVYVWDSLTGVKLNVLCGHSGLLRSASFSPDGKDVIAASEDRTVRVWSLDSSKEITRISGYTDLVTWASFSPDKRLIATASRDGNATIFDVAESKQTKKLCGHTNTVNSALFSSDGRYLVTASMDCTARIWDVNSGKTVKIMNHSTFAIFALFSPDTESVVVALSEGSVCIWQNVFLPEKFDLVQMITRKKRLLPRCLVQLIGNYVMQ